MEDPLWAEEALSSEVVLSSGEAHSLEVERSLVAPSLELARWELEAVVSLLERHPLQVHFSGQVREVLSRVHLVALR